MIQKREQGPSMTISKKNMKKVERFKSLLIQHESTRNHLIFEVFLFAKARSIFVVSSVSTWMKVFLTITFRRLNSQRGWETGRRHMYEMWAKLKWTFQNQISSCLNSIFICNFSLMFQLEDLWWSTYSVDILLQEPKNQTLFGWSKLEIFRSSLHSDCQIGITSHYISLPNINFGASDFERLPAGAIPATPNPSQSLSLIMSARHSFRTTERWSNNLSLSIKSWTKTTTEVHKSWLHDSTNHE